MTDVGLSPAALYSPTSHQAEGATSCREKLPRGNLSETDANYGEENGPEEDANGKRCARAEFAHADSPFLRRQSFLDPKL